MSDDEETTNIEPEQGSVQHICPHIAQLLEHFKDNNVVSELVTYQRPDKASSYIITDANNVSSNISLDNILRAVLFKDEEKYLLVVATMQVLLDYVVLFRELGCDKLKFIDDGPYAKYYDINFNSYLPLPKYLKITGILDFKIQENSKATHDVFIPTAHDDVLLKLKWSDYLQLHADLKVMNCSININEIYEQPVLQLSRDNIIRHMNKISLTERRIKQRVNKTFEMPVMPAMADQLLKLRIDPAADAHSLAKLVERDPSLSAQLISWAYSPYYGYLGKITSVEDAIIKVLGFDLVMNIALGIAIGQIMNVSNEGKLGLLKHWRHSLYAASFIEILVKKIPGPSKPYRGLAYLCGLLHNFGHLLLGQVFSQQFQILNQMISANPGISILDIEHYLFNTDHQKIGSWLMKIWHMPEELTLAVANHHDSSFLEGKESMYANLVLITNRLLARQEIGDEFVEVDFPEQVLQNIQLSEQKINNIFEEFWNNKEGLDNIINSLARGRNINS